MNSPPNLLFLFTDEQRHDTMAAYGNTAIQAPNLNGLAQQSVVFEHAYVTQPVCTPSRSSILTGLYPHTTGCTENNIPLRPETRCLPEMLTQGTYKTGYHGKWHLGNEILAQHGFEEWISIEDGYRRYYSPDVDRNAHSTYYHFLIDHGFDPARRDGDFEHFDRATCARLAEQFGKPAFLAQQASRFIRENRDRPFVLFVNFLEPHMPFFGPRDGQHDAGAVVLPKNFDAVPTKDQPLKTQLFQRAYFVEGHGGVPLKTQRDWRRLIANYWGLISLVDTHVGTILQTLDDCDLAQHTIVVYTSDHGDMMGSHRLLGKCTMFEEAVKVPLLMRIPWLKNGHRRISVPVSQIDLVPTLLDWMQQPIPGHLQGQSLRPLVEGATEAWEKSVFVEWNGKNNGFGDVLRKASVPASMLELATREQADAAIGDPVRTVIRPQGWKLNYSPLGEHGLYDLRSDPGETRNLVRHERQVARDLWAHLCTWQERTEDDVDVSSAP